MPLFGRNYEIDYLQEIVASFSEDIGAIDQSFQRNYDRGCHSSVPTESSSSEDDDPVDFGDEIPIFIQRCTKFLCNAHERGRCHFILVSGPPGAGKRTLIAAATNKFTISEQKYPFILASARILPVKKAGVNAGPNRNLTAILEAFQEIALIVSQQNLALRLSLSQKLRELLANPEDTSTLCELIPCVRKIIQEGDRVDPSHDSVPDEFVPSNHFMLEAKPSNIPPFVPGAQLTAQQIQAWIPLLRTFVHAVICSVPVVLLLDDFQNADETLLKLIISMLPIANSGDHKNESLKGLLLVATYSEVDDVPAPYSLLRFIENYRYDDGNPNASAPTDLQNDDDWKPIGASPNVFHARYQIIHHIVVSDLTWEDVSEWVQDCGGVIQQCSATQRDAITDVVFRHSNGNPLHIQLLLQYLQQDEALLQEPIHKKRIPSKLDDLYAIILLRQDKSILKAVQVSALLAQYGDTEINCKVLEIALNTPCMDILEAAYRVGLIKCSATRPTIYFCLEGFQKATLDTISDSSSLCLDIGRRIWSSAILSERKREVSDNDVIARVLLSTQLLRNCIDLLSDIDERIYMSQLCYEAGQQSSSVGNFFASVKLFEFAICVLGSELWRNDLYEASLVLHNAAAQAYCSVADFINMKRMLDVVFDNATSFRDKLPAYLIMVYSSGSGHQLLEMHHVSSMVLQELGEPVNDNPCTLTVLAYLRMAKWTLRGKTDRFICNLPITDDTDHLVKTQLLCFVMFTGYMAFPNRAIFLCCRLILSAMKYGICGPSAMAFSSYAYFMSGRGDFEEGHRIGQLVLQLGERFGTWWPRLHTLIYGYVNHWTYPLRDSLEPLKRIQRASLLFGDLEIYAVSTNLYLRTSFCSGVALSVLEPTVHLFCLNLAAVGQKNQLLSILQLWSLINDLQGGKNMLGLDGDISDTSSALKQCIKEGNKIMTGNFCIYRMVWYYYIADYAHALLMAKKAFKNRNIGDYTLTFYEGLAALAIAWSSKSCFYRRSVAIGKKSIKCMTFWAYRCPNNFRNKELLLRAELAALTGKSSQALSLFKQSITKANHEEFIHEEAIAYERLGHYQRRIGNVSDAKISFTNARSAYEKWGASILVDRMNDLLSST